MFVSLATAALAGLLMSQHARVWLLFAVIGGAMLAVFAAGLSSEMSIGGIVGRAVLIGIAIQLGYALGLFGRLFSPRTQTRNAWLGKY